MGLGFSAILALLLAGCGSGPTFSLSGAAIPPTFTAVQQQILIPYCVQCHSTSDPKGSVSISSYAEVMASPGAVSPYAPSQSQLYMTCYTGEMPRGDNGKGKNQAVKLSDAALQALYNWIVAGAPNN